MDLFQLVFKPGYGMTSVALVNDLCQNLDVSSASFLSFFNLLVSFNTNSYVILQELRTGRIVLQWLLSFLSGPCQLGGCLGRKINQAVTLTQSAPFPAFYYVHKPLREDIYQFRSHVR